MLWVCVQGYQVCNTVRSHSDRTPPPGSFPLPLIGLPAVGANIPPPTKVVPPSPLGPHRYPVLRHFGLAARWAPVALGVNIPLCRSWPPGLLGANMAQANLLGGGGVLELVRVFWVKFAKTRTSRLAPNQSTTARSHAARSCWERCAELPVCAI